jgi:hypothetical protein
MGKGGLVVSLGARSSSRTGLNIDLTVRAGCALMREERAAEPPALHVRCPNLSLDDFLRFVIKPLHVTFGGLIGCLRRF